MADEKESKSAKKKADKDAKKKAEKETKKSEKKSKKTDHQKEKRPKKNRSSKESDNDDKHSKNKTLEKSKETQQRNKLLLVAKMMKAGRSSSLQHTVQLSPSENSCFEQEESTEFRLILPKLPLESLGMYEQRDGSSVKKETHKVLNDETSSQTTHTTSDIDGTFHSCNSRNSSSRYSSCSNSYSDDASSVSTSSAASVSSFYSRTQTATIPIQVMTSWESAKYVEGYKENLTENLICEMIRLRPERNIRRELGIRNFRSSAFFDLARSVVDCIDIVVTLLGPDVDDIELIEVGEELAGKGISPDLFCTTLTVAMHELLGDVGFPKEAREGWDQAFTQVANTMKAVNC